jgi:hypothetical protein
MVKAKYVKPPVRHSRSIALPIPILIVRGGGWSKPHLGGFTPRKEIRYQLHRRLGELWGQHNESGKLCFYWGLDLAPSSP